MDDTALNKIVHSWVEGLPFIKNVADINLIGEPENMLVVKVRLRWYIRWWGDTMKYHSHIVDYISMKATSSRYKSLLANKVENIKIVTI